MLTWKESMIALTCGFIAAALLNQITSAWPTELPLPPSRHLSGPCYTPNVDGPRGALLQSDKTCKTRLRWRFF